MKAHLAAVTMLFLSAPALAIPTLAVDADPTLPGVQATRQVAPGQTFEVAVTVAGITPASPLQSFQIELEASGGLLSPLDALDGGFLEPPVLVLEEVIGASSFRFAEISLDASGVSGDGVLALLVFQALDLGVASLTLPTALLSAPFGTPIGLGEIQGASIEVTNAVPEPSTALLLALGLFAASNPLLNSALSSRRRRGRPRNDRHPCRE